MTRPLLGLAAALAAATLVAGPPAVAEDLPGIFGGRLEALFAYGIEGDGEVAERDLLAELEWQHRWGDGWEVEALGRARFEDRLEPEPYRELEIRELVFSRVTAGTTVRIGRQQVVWGKADGLRLLDVVNPLDLRELILDDYQDSRIPLWMVNGELYRGDHALQILVIPDLTFNRPAAPGGTFHAPAPAPPGLPVTVRPVEDVANRVENWEAGLRWSALVHRVDFTVNGLYGWDDTPVPFQHRTATGVEVAPRIVRRRLLGVSGDLPLGPTVLRLEAVFTPDSHRPAAGGEAVGGFLRQRTLDAVVGLDWLHRDWFVSPQVFRGWVLDPDPALAGDTERTYLTLLVRKTLAQDRLRLQLFTLYGAEDEDTWIQPRVAYRIRGRAEISLGADLLGGDPDGFFGRFDDRDRLTLELAYHF